MQENKHGNQEPDFGDWLILFGKFLLLIPMILSALVALVIGGVIFLALIHAW